MDPAILLLLLRLLGAALLLSFLGVIAWLIYQDMRATTSLLVERQRSYGTLRVMAADGSDAPAEERLYPLAPVTSIGRAVSNTVILDDDYASSEHALLMLRGQQWWLEDLNSRNGTLLNDVPLHEATVVSPGDIITIGSTHLKIEPAF